MDFHVGQTVMHLDHNLANSRSGRGREVEATVTKLGRRNVTVMLYGREHAFRMDTGWSVKDFGGRIITPEQRLREKAERAVHDSLRAHGVTIMPPASRYPLETWTAVLDLLDAAALEETPRG